MKLPVLPLLALALLALTLCAACVQPPPLMPDPYLRGGAMRAPQAVEEVAGVGDEIVACGQRFSTGVPVVLWSDPGGHDAYKGYLPGGAVEARGFRPGRRPQPSRGAPPVPPDADDPAQLDPAVDQFVLHYDVCGLSSVCFRVLEERGLSVHFLLDLDGTIYQTMDLRDPGWHATKANTRAVGVEIAQVGARSPDDTAALEDWYSRDAHGLYVDVPPRFGDGDLRVRDYVGRPARPTHFSGTINGSRLVQYDFTDEQYESLIALTRTLTEVLPAMRPQVPRDAAGQVVMDKLPDAEYEAFSGILGHNHVQLNKTDPGPAFDWERLVRGLR